jgi:L-lactate dehydrogenase complex protein LldF
MAATFHETIHVALSDIKLQQTILTATNRFNEKRRELVGPDFLPDYQELRSAANAIKKHTLDHLDSYLELLESKVQEHGGEVVWCPDG